MSGILPSHLVLPELHHYLWSIWKKIHLSQVHPEPLRNIWSTQNLFSIWSAQYSSTIYCQSKYFTIIFHPKSYHLSGPFEIFSFSLALPEYLIFSGSSGMSHFSLLVQNISFSLARPEYSFSLLHTKFNHLSGPSGIFLSIDSSRNISI